MTLFEISLFIHILAVMGLAIAFGFAWASVSGMRRSASTIDARHWLKLFAYIPALMKWSTGLVLLSGVYMTLVLYLKGRDVAWIVVALAAAAVLGFLGGRVEADRVEHIRKYLATADRSLPVDQRLLRDTILFRSLCLSSGLLIGITFLMVFRPTWWVGALGIVFFSALAWLLGWLGSKDSPS